MKSYTFDEICESQDFNHDERFVKVTDVSALLQRIEDSPNCTIYIQLKTHRFKEEHTKQEEENKELL